MMLFLTHILVSDSLLRILLFFNNLLKSDIRNTKFKDIFKDVKKTIFKNGEINQDETINFTDKYLEISEVYYADNENDSDDSKRNSAELINEIVLLLSDGYIDHYLSSRDGKEIKRGLAEDYNAVIEEILLLCHKHRSKEFLYPDYSKFDEFAHKILIKNLVWIYDYKIQVLERHQKYKDDSDLVGPNPYSYSSNIDKNTFGMNGLEKLFPFLNEKQQEKILWTNLFALK